MTSVKVVDFGGTSHARTITSFKYSLCKVAFYAKNDEDSSRKMLVVFGACGGGAAGVKPRDCLSFRFSFELHFLIFQKNRRKYEVLIL